jgi:hippurate hydrolase
MDAQLLKHLTAWRHHLHAHPELSLAEEETARFIAARLSELGIPFVTGVGGHGIVATLKRGEGQRAVGLRADIDALPIAETGSHPYISTRPGVMHACGHDGHTVCLLGAAAELARDESWSGTVQLIFQAAEENGKGARAMIDDGLFERFPLERVFTFHNWPGLEAGTVAVHHGPVMAQGGRWFLTLHGLAGHAAKPHTTRDPIVGMAHLIVALQTIVSRNVDPLDSVVLSIGSIHGGAVSNQIPGSVTVLGTLRTYRQEVREQVMETMHRIASGVAAGFGMTAELEFTPSGRATVNTPEEAKLAAKAARIIGLTLREDMPPSTAGDDFAFFLRERPGSYVWIGNGPAGEDGELHNPRYDFNDSIIPAAVDWLTTVARLAVSDVPTGCQLGSG